MELKLKIYTLRMPMFHIFRIGMMSPQILLMTQYVAVKITHKTEDIDIAVIDDYLSQLEDKLMDYFKKNFNIELLSYDCDD